MILVVSFYVFNYRMWEYLIFNVKFYYLIDLIVECCEYVKIIKWRISFEYILLVGFNDLLDYVRELVKNIWGF